MPCGLWTWVDLKKHVLVLDAHWHNLANTTELSMCCGSAAFLPTYFDHLLLLL